MPLGDDGPRIVLMRPGHYDPDVASMYEIMKVDVLFNDLLLLEDDHCVISGYVHIVDFTGFSAKHMLQFQPAKMKHIVYYTEEALPIRVKASHAFNTGSTFETMYGLIKPFLPSKVQERVSLDTFFPYFSITFFIIIFFFFLR